MKAIFGGVLALVTMGFLSSASAQEVNVVSPVDGGPYPITDPAAPALRSAYITASFRATCGGGPHTVEWGFGGPGPFVSLGKASFYDQFSAQFVHKLPGGPHYFRVTASTCGSDMARFRVGG